MWWRRAGLCHARRRANANPAKVLLRLRGPAIAGNVPFRGTAGDRGGRIRARIGKADANATSPRGRLGANIYVTSLDP
ncbi:hypothetical protein SKAU_G00309790 [Synaphobranchus kaupii]|uniref:Uncharacterized protein n=1 Tax=Synaphobranchus kaupii TaxID=118154 RepID=A0A9Q1ERF2_SYNKA|nr:hypothetical protein SKAU_G00309790 [Synaphobranchus kaupii]